MVVWSTRPQRTAFLYFATGDPSQPFRLQDTGLTLAENGCCLPGTQDTPAVTLGGEATRLIDANGDGLPDIVTPVDRRMHCDVRNGKRQHAHECH